MEKKIKMMAAASRALHYLRRYPKAIDEEVLQSVSDFISDENIKSEDIKFGMIAASTETIKITRGNSSLNDKEILKKVMEKIPGLLQDIEPINN